MSTTAAWSETHGQDSLILGGSKHYQPAEGTFASNQLVEKSMDRRNAGAVGSMDVANFHDCLGWDSACDSMARRSVPEADAMMLMRLHSRPQVRIRVGDALTDVVERSRGAFTGARTAATIGQWVVEDAFLDCAGDLAVRGWALEEGRYVTAMAWADNLISFGDSVHEAAGVLTIIEGALNLKGHTIKSDSRELLQVSQQPIGEWQLEAGGCAWQVKDELVVIGRTVSGNASSHADRNKALEKIQRSWFKHRRLLQNNALPFASRAQMWTRHAESIFNFYAGTWVLGRQMVNALDTVQLRHVAAISKIPRLPFEEVRLWRARRARAARPHIGRRWGDIAISRAMNWLRHLRRHPDYPASLLLRCQDREWLQQRRTQYHQRAHRGEGFWGGRTATRVTGGQPARWEGAWTEALDHDPDRRQASEAEVTRARRAV